MGVLKLFGLSSDERRSLLTKVRVEDCAEGQLSELAMTRPDDETWVVSVSAAPAFLDEVFRRDADRARPIEKSGGANRVDADEADTMTTVAQDDLARLPRAVLWVP